MVISSFLLLSAQLWYFLLFVGGTAVQADELLLGAVACFVVFIAIVVEGLLWSRILSDIFFVIFIARVILEGSRRAELLLVCGRRCFITIAHDAVRELLPVLTSLALHVPRVRNGKKQEYRLDDRPSVIANSANHGNPEKAANGEPGLHIGGRGAVIPVG